MNLNITKTVKEKLQNNQLSSIIVSIFVISTFFVLPIVFRKDYTDLFDIKYKYYYATALIAIVLITIDIFHSILKKNVIVRFNMLEKLLMFFLLACIISTIQSDFKFEAFWGNEARYNGLFLMLLTCTTTFFIGRFLNMKQSYLNILLAGGLVVSVVGILDFFYIDILNLKWNMTREKYEIFTSTIGNINSYTSYIAILLGVSSGLFIIENKRVYSILYLFLYGIFFTAIIMGVSDNAYLSIIAVFAFLPLYAFGKRQHAKRYFSLLFVSLLLLQVISLINTGMADKVVGIDSLLKKLTGTWWSWLPIVLVGVISAWLHFTAKNNTGDRLSALWRYVWIGILGVGIASVLFVLYDVNISGNIARYGAMENYLHFDDEWGTYRGYAWRIAWENYTNFSPLHKLFGYGLDTFGILTIFNNKHEMYYEMGSRYDSVHNEYLQYLITIGIVGLIAYLLFFCAIIKTFVGEIKNKPYILGIILGIVAYWTQALVNISQVPVAPLMWCLIAVGMATCRRDEY